MRTATSLSHSGPRSPVAAFHRMIRPRSSPVTTVAPSGLNATDSTSLASTGSTRVVAPLAAFTMTAVATPPTSGSVTLVPTAS